MASKFPDKAFEHKISNEESIDQEPNRSEINSTDQEEDKIEWDDKSIAEVHELITKAKFGKFAQIWDILDRKPHYLNYIPEKRAWGVLHQAAYLGRKEAVIKVLSYPQCDPYIKTNQDTNNKFGPGRTADEITSNVELKCLIVEAQNRYKFLHSKMSRHLKDNLNYRTQDKEDSNALAGYIALGDWDSVLNTLMSNPHLANVACLKTGLTALHEMTIIDNLNIVTQLLTFSVTNPFVETVASQSHTHGQGKTPEQLTQSQKVLDEILEKKEKINRSFLSPPTYVLPWKADSILCNFFLNVLEDYTDSLCPPDLTAKSDKSQTLPSLLLTVFTHIDTDSNWMLAKREVAFQIRNFAVEYSQLLDGSEDKQQFYANIIQMYTGEDKKMLYHEFNELFKEQLLSLGEGKSVETNLVFGTYCLVLNALLMYWKEMEICNQSTNRGVVLDPELQAELVEGFEFTSLNLFSCSLAENARKNFKAKCMLKIDNSTVCPWSPKLISKYSATAEDEYLYPSGARFRVTHCTPNYLNLKLITPQ